MISDRLDVQIYHVMVELEEIGIPFGLFNAADFPTSTLTSQRISSSVQSCELALDGGPVVSGDDVRAVWYRKPGLPRLDARVNVGEREFAFAECQAGLRGLYDGLAHAYWMSPLDNIRTASNKLRHLRRAAQLGFEVPATLFTNDEAEAQAFARSVGQMIFKPIGEPGLIQREGAWDYGSVVGELYTTRLDAQTFDRGLPRLQACPVLLQEYVDKDVELRVTVVDSVVFAVEIHSQDEAVSAVDWKRGDPLTMEHRVHDLPEHIETACVALVKSFGLEYGAIDMIKTPEGRYVFLELNPNGQYGWLEDVTPVRISRAIAERLASACGS